MAANVAGIWFHDERLKVGTGPNLLHGMLLKGLSKSTKNFSVNDNPVEIVSTHLPNSSPQRHIPVFSVISFLFLVLHPTLIRYFILLNPRETYSTVPYISVYLKGLYHQRVAYGLDDDRSSIPGTSRNYFSSPPLWAHPSSYPMGTIRTFPAGKEARAWSWPLHLVPRLNNEWSYISTPTYVFTVWCLITPTLWLHGMVLS
jgi:hypothetical protein